MKTFTYYKNSIDSILENSFRDSKKFKKNLSVIMGAMKYSKVLREYFTLYNELESKKFKTEEESRTYINEAINYLKENKKYLKKITPILDKIISDRKDLCKETHNKIYTNIDKVVFNNSINNLEIVAESRSFLIKNLLGESKKNIKRITNPKILSHVISKKYSKAYDSSLSESQKEILKNTLLMTEDTLTKELTNIKEIALNKINTLISESKEDSLSAKLVQVKNEIKGLESSKKTYIRVRGLIEDLK
tara:strand:+ start:4112 stop:4855 length:744 start_codon:yes stop_codon:yes gene_type:complete